MRRVSESGDFGLDFASYVHERYHTASMGDYLRPQRLEEALEALTRPYTVLAAGTDFYPARVGRSIDKSIPDICGIGLVCGVAALDGGLRLRRATLAKEGNAS